MISAILTLAASNPIDHVTDKPIFGQWYVSNVTVMLVLGAIITALIVIPPARRIVSGKNATLDDLRAKGLWANLVEAVCLYLRDEVFRPVLGEETDRYTPMLWTFFWFILVCNLMGLIPFLDLTAPFLGAANHGHGIGGTATQSIWVTGALATVAFLFYNGIAFAKSPLGYLKHLTAGAPVFMWIIMVPVEIIGTFVKPFALALRLFANMTGGHIILAVLLGFVVAMIEGLGSAGYGLALIPILGATAINLLEVMVAFIQAYIFTFLTCLFLGQLVVHEHEEHHEEEAHSHEPTTAAAGGHH
ncbi:MAG: F0F1 ATP synthase subunit A [Phycisphaeraceae bacterium]|nr:F0F1 ATP synthase subunit A [Phycisphaeraceae bacterium]